MTKEAKNDRPALAMNALQLLDVLVSFVQPIVNSYLDPTGDPGAFSMTKDYTTKGQNLLKELEVLVVGCIRSNLPLESPPEVGQLSQDDSVVPQADSIDDPYDLDPDLLRDKFSVSSYAVMAVESLPDVWPSTVFKSMTFEALQVQVFSNMPIRMLSFDSSGSNITLIDRNTLLGRFMGNILAQAQQPQFESEWFKTLATVGRGYEFAQEGTNKQSAMINGLVQEHTKYAILSHTWMREIPGEVTLPDWTSAPEKNPRGYAKIAKFCEVAANDHGLTIGWVDNVCIDKQSSSELDESIRSMYKWYREAHICIAYLAGSRFLEDIPLDPWFTRGWTLQELLAPRSIRFYNKSWEELVWGNKDLLVAPTLWSGILSATSITESELEHCRHGNMNKIPVSRMLQLASRRKVTREEDSAYSLMGLLSVDIGVAYGEGSGRAFFRLIRELLNTRKHVLDIFNRGYGRFYDKSPNPGLLPTSIRQYYMGRSVLFDVSNEEISSLLDTWLPSEPIIFTHLGVRVPLILCPALRIEENDVLVDIHSKRYSCYGEYYGTVPLYFSYEENTLYRAYNLMDSRIWSKSILSSLRSGTNDKSSEGSPQIITFGILNFNKDNDNIVLPDNCLSVALNCRDNPVNVSQSDPISILPVNKAPVIQIKSTKNKDLVVPVHKLQKHGMQFMTLYL